MASNDKESKAIGLKIVEGQSLFALTFTSYDRISNVTINYNNSLNTTEKMNRFSNDQLTERLMIKDMGKGIE